jgi:hypothetical protein
MQKSILSVGIYLAGMVILAASLPARACRNGPLLDRVNEASELVASGSPVAALVCYETTAASEALRQNDSPSLEERFWFEYHDAAQQAATLIPGKRDFYLGRVVDIADSYIQFYRLLDQKSLQNLTKNHQDRISNVLFDMGNAYEALHQNEELLNLFESYADEPAMFTPRIRRLWEKTLRSLPRYDRERTDDEIVHDVQQDEKIALRWKTYRDFLQGFAQIRNMRRESEQAQARLRRILAALV